MKRFIIILAVMLVFLGCGPNEKPTKKAKYVKLQTVSCIRTSDSPRYSVTYNVIDPNNNDEFFSECPLYNLQNITKEELDSITALTK